MRTNPNKIDVSAVLNFLQRNRITRSVSLMGGEATLHPEFEPLMEGLLRLYRKIVITTNLNGKWYEGFPQSLELMKKWGRKVKWNTTFHPAWMEPDLYIERVNAIRAAGLRLEQVATPDTDELSPEVSEKLHKADIGWKLQPFTGRDASGRMAPQTWDDVNCEYPFAFDPAKYIEHYDEYVNECEDASYEGSHKRERAVQCKTPRFLIGPDNMVYPCHRHLYLADREYACGSIHDIDMQEFRFKWQKFLKRWTLRCDTKCNPCDFREVKITAP